MFPRSLKASIVTVFHFGFRFCSCKGWPVLLFTTIRIMSGSGLAHKIDVSLISMQKIKTLFLWQHQKESTCKHVSTGILFPFGGFSIFGRLYCLFCLQTVKKFTTSKPFLRLLYLLTISVRCLSFGNILWEKTSWEISWLITQPDLGGQ